MKGKKGFDILVREISKHSEWSEEEAKENLKLIFSSIQKALLKEPEIWIREVGFFKLQKYKPRRIKMPHESEHTYSESKFRASFRFTKKFQEEVHMNKSNQEKNN